MTGSTPGIIIMIVVVMIVLAAWIILVFYADAHPEWRRRAPSGHGYGQADGSPGRPMPGRESPSRAARKTEVSAAAGRGLRAEGDEHAGPLLVGYFLAGVATPGDLCDLIACDAAEALDHARRVPPGEPGLDDEPGRMSAVARPVEQDDRPAHRVPEDDRSGDPGRVTENAAVVSAGLEAPGGCIPQADLPCLRRSR
jgi:hypothetical protein